VGFRLTESGWEIGNRMNTFVFIAVGLVVAVSIVYYWQSRVRWWSLILTSLVLGDILLGAVVIGGGSRVIRGPYMVGSDPDSIEPMGVDASLWAKKWLGEGNTFASDRTNRTLLATYGQQNVVSSIEQGVEVSPIFYGGIIDGNTLFSIRKGKIDYLLVDLRLTTGRPVIGEYYENGEKRYSNGATPVPRDLLKFENKVSRIFDDGWIVIYDSREFLRHE
jgi:hypothetical protein